MCVREHLNKSYKAVLAIYGVVCSKEFYFHKSLRVLLKKFDLEPSLITFKLMKFCGREGEGSTLVFSATCQITSEEPSFLLGSTS